jgi:hypothetical protein
MSTENISKHIRCNWTPERLDPHARCRKFAQHRVSYILNRELLSYAYCPPHSRAVQKELARLGIPCAVSSMLIPIPLKLEGNKIVEEDHPDA